MSILPIAITFVFISLDSILWHFRPRTKKQGLMLVHLDNIGDFILWLPLARTIVASEKFERPIGIVCNQSCIALAESTNLFEYIIGVNTRKYTSNLSYRLTINRRVSRVGAKLAICASYSRSLLVSDSIIRSTYADIKIGSSGDLSNISYWQKRLSDHWYNTLLPSSQNDLMELDRNEEFLRLLNVGNHIPHQFLFLSEPLVEKKINITGSYYVLFPGASSPIRQWPIESFAMIAEHLSNTYGWRPVVCGAVGEQDLCARLSGLLKSYDILNVAGNTTMPELVEIIRDAKLVISNETSAIHISPAVNTPSVCILGGGHYGRFMPYRSMYPGVSPLPVFSKMDCYGCNWICHISDSRSNPVPCILQVSAEHVKKSIEEYLRQCSNYL
jgi:ADP-heptose:LPS heptosyltransferase